MSLGEILVYNLMRRWQAIRKAVQHDENSLQFRARPHPPGNFYQPQKNHHLESCYPKPTNRLPV